MSNENELGDIYTKLLPQDKFVHMRSLVDVYSICIQNYVCPKPCESKDMCIQTHESKSFGKHMEIKHHFIRDYFQKGSLDLNFMSNQNELVDIYTKPLPLDKLVHMRNLVSMTFIKKRSLNSIWYRRP
ncbi:Copia protein, partial [Mucuna pruriens]